MRKVLSVETVDRVVNVETEGERILPRQNVAIVLSPSDVFEIISLGIKVLIVRDAYIDKCPVSAVVDSNLVFAAMSLSQSHELAIRSEA